MTSTTATATLKSAVFFAAVSATYKQQVATLKDARDNHGIKLRISLRADAKTIDAELRYQGELLEAAEKEAATIRTVAAPEETITIVSGDKDSGKKVEATATVIDIATEAPITVINPTPTPASDEPEKKEPLKVDDDFALLYISDAEIKNYRRGYSVNNLGWIDDVAIPDILYRSLERLAESHFPTVPSSALKYAVSVVLYLTEFDPHHAASHLVPKVKELYNSLPKLSHFDVKNSYSLGGALEYVIKKEQGFYIHTGTKTTTRTPVLLESQLEHYSEQSMIDLFFKRPEPYKKRGFTA